MPISDQVIELETKKKGRTALFIVLIAVLAAASAAFAVLWVLKEPASDPPAIEKISVASTDLCQTNDTGAGETESYLVAPSCRYTMYFDVVLKNEGDLSTVENTNSVLTFTTDPVGMLTILDTSGLDPENPKRYKFEFRLTDKAALSVGFKLFVTSEFTPEVNKVINFEVQKTYAESFDIANDENEGKTVSGRTSGKKYELAYSEANSTPERKFYKLAANLPYYEAPLTNLNEKYVLSFAALGKLGTNGNNAKITLNALGIDANGRQGKSDQIQVFVADKANPKDEEYHEIVDDKLNDKEQATRTQNLTLDLNPSSDYCRSFLYFEANDGTGTCVSTIKLVANSFYENESQKPQKLEIVIEVNFESSNNFNRFTEIRFKDPYVHGGGNINEINLYLESFSQNNPFVVSDFITAVKGGKEITDQDELWGNNGLRAYVTTETGSQTIPTEERCIMSTISGEKAKFAIAPTGNKKTGVGYVTVLDSDPDGFGAYLRIKINVRAPITDLAVRGEDGLAGKQASVSTYAGREAEFEAIYDLHRDHTAEEDIKTVNTKLTAEYPAGVAKPRYDGNKLSNADETIVIDGMTESKGVITVTPKVALKSLSPKIKFTVGKKIKPGNYNLVFKLDSQALKDGVAEIPKTITVNINVIDLAGQIRLNEKYPLAELDKYTKLEMGEIITEENTAKATVTVATGTGTKSGNVFYTSFKFTDLLEFYSKNDKNEFIKVSDAIAEINKAVLKVESLGRPLDEILKGGVASGELIVPAVNRDNCGLKITLGDFEMTVTLVYKLPVLNIAFDAERDYYNQKFDIENSRGYKTEYYSFDSSDESLGEILANGDYDSIHAVTPSGNKTELNELIDGDKFNMDIAVLRNRTAWTLLPKKLITVKNSNGGNDTTTYYYFPYTDISGITNENYKNFEKYALFRTGYKSPLQNTNLTVLKDLYSLSYLDSHTYDYQNIRIYFSYGDDVIKLNNRDVVTDIVTGSEQWEIDETKVTVGNYVMYANYMLTRAVDDVLVFSDGSWSTDKVEENHVIKTASGTSFLVYYSEIINIIDYSKIFTEETYEDNFLPSPSSLDNLHGKPCVILAKDDKSRNIAYVKAKYRTSVDSQVQSNITQSAGGSLAYGNWSFIATCSQGANATCGITVYVEHSKNTISNPIEVQVSNNSLEIEKIELLAEDNSPLSAVVMYKNGGYPQTVRFKYKVTYKTYNEQGRFDAFDWSATTGLEYVNPPKGFNFAVLDECLKLSKDNNDKYYWEGNAEISIANATNGTYTFDIKGVGNSAAIRASIDIRVTTLLEVGHFEAKADGANVINSNGTNAPNNAIKFIKQNTENPELSAPKITYNYSISQHNIVKFTFDFAIGSESVDTVNLKYIAKFGESSDFTDSGAVGTFYTSIPTNLGAVVDSDNTAPRVVGFSLDFTGERINNKLLVISVTETNPGTQEKNVYNLYVNITVNIPVTEAEIKITPAEGDNSMTKNADGTYTFITDGTDSDNYYTLSSILNCGEANKQPSLPSAEFKIVDAQGNSLTSEFCEISGDNKNILAVRNAVKKNGEAYIKMTVTDSATGSERTQTVKLIFNTSARFMEFNNTEFVGGNGEYAYATANNADIDCSAVIKNFGTNAAVTPQPAITYRIAEGEIDGVTLTDGRVTFNKAVNNVTFTVEATSGDFKLTVTVTVYVPVGYIDATKDGVSLDKLNLVEGERDYEFVAVAKNSNGITPAYAEVKARIEDDKADIISVSIANGVVTVKPLKAGTAKIILFVEKESVNKEITVTVTAIGISANTNKTEYDVSTDSIVTINLTAAGIDSSSLQNVKVTRDSENADTTVDGLSGVNVVAAGKTYSVSIDNSKLTSDSMGRHTIYVSAEYNGKTIATSCTFNLFIANNAYTPEIEITNGGNSMENQKDTDGNYILVNSNTLYTFGLKTPPAGYSSSSVSVEYSSDQFEFNSSVEGRISKFKTDSVGKASVTVTVTILNNTYTATMDNLMVVDSESSKITAKLYYSESDSVAVDGSTGAITGVDEVTSSVYIDYSGFEDRKVITFVIDYTGAYYLNDAISVGTGTFNINASAELEFIGAKLLSGGNKKYYAASYYATKTGAVSLSAKTVAIGGVVYGTEVLSANLNAYNPEFNNSTGIITVNPGEEKSSTGISLKNNGFKGNVDYSASYPESLIESASYNGSTFTVKAKHGAGGTAIVHVSATVKSGACAGKIVGFDMTVNIASVKAPTVTAKNITNVSKGTFVNLNTALQIAAGDDDSEFEYSVEYKQGNNVINNGSFTAPSAEGVVTITYIVEITAGAYSGISYSGSFTVTIVPDASVNLSATVTSPVNPVTLGVTVPGVNSTDYSVFYTADNADAGTFNGNVFTPKNGFVGTVKFTAHINVTAGTYAGASYEIESDEVTVAGLTSSSTLQGNPGDDNITLVFSHTAGSVSIESSDPCITANGATLKISHDANAGTANKTVVLKVKVTDGETEYYGEFEFIVTPKVLPTLSATQGSVNDNEFTVTNPIAGAQYKAEIISGGNLVNNPDAYKDFGAYVNPYVFTKKTNTAGGTVAVKVSMLLRGAYGNITGEQEFRFIVEGEAEPILSEILNDSSAQTLTASVNKDSALYEFVLTSGSEYIKLGTAENGVITYEFIKYATAAGVKATVTVYATIDSGNYIGKVFNKSVEITVPVVTLSLDTSADKTIKANVTGGYNPKNYSFTLSGDTEYVKLKTTTNANIYEYEFTKFAKHGEDKSVTVTVTVTFANGYVLTKTHTVNVPTEVVPTLSVNAENGKINAEVKTGDNVYSGAVKFEYSVADAQKQYVNVDSDGNYTFVYGIDMPATIAVNVKATILSGTYAGKIFTDDTVVITVDSAPTVEITPKLNGGSTTEGILDYTVDSKLIKVLYFETTSAYISISGNNYTLKPDINNQTSSVTVHYLVLSGVYKGNLLESSFTVEVAAVVPTFNVSKGTDTQDAVMLKAELGGGYAANYECEIPEAYRTYITAMVTPAADGKSADIAVKHQNPSGTVERTIEVKVKATIRDGAHANEVKEFTLDVTVKLSALELTVDTTEDGKIKASVVMDSGVYAGDVEFGYAAETANASFITIDSQGNYTFVYGENMPEKITVTVSATVISGIYQSETPITKEVEITVATVPEIEIAENPLKLNADGKTGTFDYTQNENFENIKFSVSSAYIEIAEDNTFALKPDSAEDKSVEITVTFNVKNGVYAGSTVTRKFNVTVKAETSGTEINPDETKDPEAEETANS